MKTLDPTIWSIQTKTDFLDLMNELGAHTIWKAPVVLERLENIGIDTDLSPSETLLIENVEIAKSQGEWGTPGIYAPNILDLVIDACNFDEPIVSDMTGRGFYHRNMLSQLADRWGIDRDY
jgi:hypothetical protein